MSQAKSLPRRDFLKAAGVAAGAAFAGPVMAADAEGPTTPVPEATALGTETTVQSAALEAIAPVLGYQFQLVFNSAVYATFSEVTGIGSESTVTQVRMGDGSLTYIPGAAKWMPITLKRGIMARDTTALDLWTWRQAVISGKAFRKTGSIVMMKIETPDQPQPVAQWNFTRGWPSRIEAPVPAADAANNAVEEIDLTHDGVVRVPLPVL